MKKILAIIMCMATVLCLASCGGGSDKETTRISPDELLTADTVSDITGVTMKADKEGVTNDGSARTVVYVPNPIGSADTVTVSIEQFSESVTTNQVWADYENSRIRRKDMEFVEGIGEDCYIAYPYINVYVRGCFIRISAGSGDNDEQADLLKSLATSAALKVEGMITPEQVEAANANVLK